MDKKYNSVNDYKLAAKSILPEDIYNYLVGGSDDSKTLERNIDAYQQYQIRPRRLIDVSKIDTSVSLFGVNWKSPILIAPVGFQGLFHTNGEIATAKAANRSKHQMIVSTVSNASYSEIAKEFETTKPWFQLYPTKNRATTKILIETAEANGCDTLVLTVDVPVLGNRTEHARRIMENHRDFGSGGTGQNIKRRLGNLDKITTDTTPHDPTMTWQILPLIRSWTKMNLVIKGIMTAEDAELALEYGVDGIIISNHGGRQLESGLSTLECLEEVVQAVKGQIPILIDGGIRRGTDIFKALALGANAVCVGRAFCYGLAVEGTQGVENILALLQEELVRNMQLAGVIDLKILNEKYIQLKKF